ncbi:unnamed protein product [Eruca vesicaria subsp. sativa]|uniref:Transcription factor CBF/NF-Y/archaeal histone domain-containing protein n=1 Tax=Eruca vesicaria subsp. sativa TaxID=29727 RepID=A0ABC8L9V1_ERUVS|nr:unnamed protein product [Eruca vesicaria subsp. sativa]
MKLLVRKGFWANVSLSTINLLPMLANPKPIRFLNRGFFFQVERRQLTSEVYECVSEFISFITGEASDKCQKEKRKTINGDDLLWAMTTLGFEDYVEPLKVYLQKYTEVEGERMATTTGRGDKEG